MPEEKYKIICEDNIVIAFSEEYIAFEPKGWKKDFKEQLKLAITKLKATEDEMLVAMYWEKEVNKLKKDIENVLFYNIGTGAFKNNAKTKIMFKNATNKEAFNMMERYKQNKFPHIYCYEIQKINQQCDKRENKIAEWNDVSVLMVSTDRNPLDYWKEFKMGSKNIKIHTSNYTGDFGVKINIHAPLAKKDINLAGVVKTLLDGIICVFHKFPLEIGKSEIKEIYKMLDCEETLMNRETGALGEIAYVGVGKKRKNLIWNPADNRCKQGEISILYDRQEDWLLDGNFYYIKE